LEAMLRWTRGAFRRKKNTALRDDEDIVGRPRKKNESRKDQSNKNKGRETGRASMFAEKDGAVDRA